MLTAAIIGITGQDGSLLSKLLLDKGYKVIGLIRDENPGNKWRLQKLGVCDDIQYSAFDLAEPNRFKKLLEKHQPDQLINLGGISSVYESFKNPGLSYDLNFWGVQTVLDEILKMDLGCKFFQASSSEMFGANAQIKLDEKSQFIPKSPYAKSKLLAHQACINYREKYGLKAYTAISFNHESCLRGENFFTYKVINHIKNLKTNSPPLEVGKLEIYRDWGFAPDYVEGIYKILSHPIPDDFVLSTGSLHSIKEFITSAFAYCEWPIFWEGEGVKEVGRFQRDGNIAVRVNPQFFRKEEVYYSAGNSQKAKSLLGWESKTEFKNLIKKLFDGVLQ
jgi:GDPmannose 4,6-dehydratase